MVKKQQGMLLFFVLLLPQLGWAVEEGRLADLFPREVIPFYRQEVVVDSFLGRDGVAIAYGKYEVAAEKGALVIVNGRTEFLTKYAELLYDLRQSGFSLYLMDHRGQGFSGRMLANGEKGHVRDYGDYVADLHTFVETVVNATPHRRRFLLAHSMGGTIGALYALQYPQTFAAMVLCAPMFGIETGLLPAWLAGPLLKTLNLVPGPEAFFLGGKGYDPLKSFAGNDLTGSEPRFQLQKSLVAAEPKVALGAPTNGWLRESYRAMAALADQARQVETPILLLQAGNDKVVAAAAQDRFCRQAARCAQVTIPGARHELLMAEDGIRNRVLKEVLSFVTALAE